MPEWLSFTPTSAVVKPKGRPRTVTVMRTVLGVLATYHLLLLLPGNTRSPRKQPLPVLFGGSALMKVTKIGWNLSLLMTPPGDFSKTSNWF